MTSIDSFFNAMGFRTARKVPDSGSNAPNSSDSRRQPRCARAAVSVLFPDPGSAGSTKAKPSPLHHTGVQQQQVVQAAGRSASCSPIQIVAAGCRPETARTVAGITSENVTCGRKPPAQRCAAFGSARAGRPIRHLPSRMGTVQYTARNCAAKRLAVAVRTRTTAAPSIDPHARARQVTAVTSIRPTSREGLPAVRLAAVTQRHELRALTH